MTLAQIQSLFADAGCIKLYAKPLAENDNSKNQVYFGPGFEALNLFPNRGVFASTDSKNPIFKAKLRFGWLSEDGVVADAPGAQLILYPQYPEVRFSGFLAGCKRAPSTLMAGRIRGRILFLGVASQDRVLGFVSAENSTAAQDFVRAKREPTAGVFHEMPLTQLGDAATSRARLLGELRRIHQLGWIDSKQLDTSGHLKPCNAPQCGGFTLEAELGIPKNSKAEPDYLGWEIKQHTVSNFDRLDAGTITLMTPEPTGGFYRTSGVEAFIRKFGYADKNAVADRLNFGGVHRVGARHDTTRLTMRLVGYDEIKGRITDVNGSISLVSDEEEVAAMWSFSGLLEHWSRKHAKAVYVPSQCRKEPTRQYHYGNKVRLAEGTDSLRLLKALFAGAVYYDPGIKLENISSDKPTSKRRSQFRIASRSITSLYETVEAIAL
jgi:hypothetical protein